MAGGLFQKGAQSLRMSTCGRTGLNSVRRSQNLLGFMQSRADFGEFSMHVWCVCNGGIA